MTETMPALINGLLPREGLSRVQRDEMFALLSHHFDGVAREQFERDLAEKNWVVEVRARVVARGSGHHRDLFRRHHRCSRGVGIVRPGPHLDRRGEPFASGLSPTPLPLAAAYVGVPHLPIPSGFLAEVLPTPHDTHATARGATSPSSGRDTLRKVV